MKKAQRPEQGLTYAGGRPRDEDSLTRKRLGFWDRSKWLILLAVIWLRLVWSLMGNDPLMGFADAARIQTRMGYWVFILAGLELLHQVHFLILSLIHISEPTRLGMISYAVFCLKKQ